MVKWNNLDTLASFQDLSNVKRVNLQEAMSGENGAERVKKYSTAMAEGLVYNYAAKSVDDNVLAALEKLAEEAQLAEKFEALYNGEVVNTGENRLVLHHMTRGQLGDAVTADGVDKRTFYVEQQEKIADFAKTFFLYISPQLFAPVFPVLKENFFPFTSIRTTFLTEFSLGLS